MAASGALRWRCGGRNRRAKSRTSARKHWLRRGGIGHHWGVPIDLTALPEDVATLQRMLRTVLLQQGGSGCD